MPLLIEPAHEDVDLLEWAAGNQQFIEEVCCGTGIALAWLRWTRFPSSKFAGVLCPALFGDMVIFPREQQGGKVYGSARTPATRFCFTMKARTCISGPC